MTAVSLTNRRAALTGSLILGAGALISACRSSTPSALPRSTIGEGLAISGEEADTARNAVADWLKRTQLLQG